MVQGLIHHQPFLVPNTLNPIRNTPAFGSHGRVAMISQQDQALLQMEVTRAHDSRDLEPLKAMAEGQRTSSCRPFPVPTLQWGCTEWDGTQGR